MVKRSSFLYHRLDRRRCVVISFGRFRHGVPAIPGGYGFPDEAKVRNSAGSSGRHASHSATEGSAGVRHTYKIGRSLDSLPLRPPSFNSLWFVSANRPAISQFQQPSGSHAHTDHCSTSAIGARVAGITVICSGERQPFPVVRGVFYSCVHWPRKWFPENQARLPSGAG